MHKKADIHIGHPSNFHLQQPKSPPAGRALLPGRRSQMQHFVKATMTRITLENSYMYNTTITLSNRVHKILEFSCLEKELF